MFLDKTEGSDQIVPHRADYRAGVADFGFRGFI